jgi:hypothetical protein
VAPLPVLEGHISHKRFESPLSSQSHFEDKASKERGEYYYYSRQILIKFEKLQFESNARFNQPVAGAAQVCGALAPAPLTQRRQAAPARAAMNEAEGTIFGHRQAPGGGVAFTRR